MLRRAAAVGAVVWTAVWAAGCSSRQRDLEGCRAALRNNQDQNGADLCGRLFARTGDYRAGYNTLNALYRLNRDAELPALAARLDATPAARLAQTLLAKSHLRRGDARAAEAAFRRAATLHRAANERADLVEALFHLYQLAWSAGRFRDSLQVLEESGPVITALGTDRWVVWFHQARAQTLQRVGDLPGALADLEAVEPRLASLDAFTRAIHHLRRGTLHELEGNLAAATTHYQKTIALAGTDTVAAGQSFAARGNLIDIALGRGEVAAAVAHLEAAEQRYAAADLGQQKLMRIGLSFYRAKVARARHLPAAAEKHLLEAQRVEGLPTDWRWRILRELGDVLVALGREPEAEAAYRRSLEAVEALRTELGTSELRAWFTRSAQRAHAPLFELYLRRGQPVSALGVLEGAQSRTFLDALFSAPPAPGAGPAGSLAEAMTRLDEARRHTAGLLAQPTFAARPIDAVMAETRSDHLLMFFEKGEETYRVSVFAGRIAIERLARPTSAIRSLAADFVAEVDDVRRARTLGHLLLPRVLPPAGTTLYLAPSEPLSRVPFAALFHDGRRLVERHPLAQVPSLTALAALRARAGPLGAGGNPSVVLGDPRGDLPEARREAIVVAERLGTTAHVGAAATSARLKTPARHQVAHIAVHAGVGPSGAWMELADGRLGTGDLLGLRVQAGLVVLASCASAATQQPGLWGSLASTFLASGVPRVVAALWAIDDDETRDFVQRFYDERGAHDPAGAVARVQQQWASTRPPSQWAPFIFIGLGEPAVTVATEHPRPRPSPPTSKEPK